MAIKLPKFITGADAKSRVFLIVAAATAIVVVIFLVVRYFSGGNGTTGASKVASAPGSLQSVPGAQMSPEFYRAVVQANAQASKQAQISGGSAVPTLINVPGQSGFPSDNCTVLCPGDDNANVADDINALVKQGKLTQDEANHLLDLAKRNVSVDEYAAALDELVRQGKLTPEQARALLEKYKKQHSNALLRDSGNVMDAMIKNGQLPLDVANQLLALQKSGATPAEYAAALARLVKEGKLTPEAAARLLAQYTQQQAQERAKDSAFALQQMAKSGEVTPDVAKTLADLQSRRVPVSDYEVALDKLVKDGKLTPAAMAKLLDQYKNQRQGLGPAETLQALVNKQEGDAASMLDDMVRSGRLSRADADAILAMERQATSSKDCQMGLSKFVQSKKLSPADAQRLLKNCEKLAALRAQAKRLTDMQGNNASIADYTTELKKAVQAGLITPAMASQLLEQYRAVVTPISLPGAGVAPGTETNLPGAADFAKLQEQIQSATPTEVPPIAEEFVAPEEQPAEAAAPPPAQTAQVAQDQQQRIEQLQTAMAAQAQSLIAAWAPAIMTHKDGTQEKPKSGTATTTTTTSGGGKAGTGKELTPPIIKGGTVLFAVLDTAVDSDYPDTPVMATIVQGPMKGATLLGKLALAKGKSKVALNFTLMNKEDWITGKTVSAFAIDPDTARTVMASSVDNHYLKRYGAIMATSFLAGYSNAITTAGSNTTTGIFGTSTTHPNLSSGSKIAVGLGQIGTTLGTEIADYINTPVTVKVNSGVGLGILFMSDVTA